MGLCGQFSHFKVTLKLKLDLKFFTDLEYMYKLYLLQLQTCQTYHFWVIGENMGKMSKTTFKYGLYGPQKQF